MTYSYASGGSGWTMIPCMVQFLAEVKECVALGLLDVTNLGQLGDAIHKTEPTSRHNPAKAPDGTWYVCAADFGGRDYAKLALFHQALYRAKDDRVYNHGFSQKGDGYGLSWYDGGWKWTGRDQGHCHFDVTMAFPQLSKLWFEDSLMSTRSWGLKAWLQTGKLNTQSGTATPVTPIESEEEDMTPEQSAKLDFVFNRLRGVTPDAEYYVVENGKARLVPKGTPKSQPVALLDTMDGNSLRLVLNDIVARLARLEK